jgi:diguanylate cyclase (GGDEF)-like protein
MHTLLNPLGIGFRLLAFLLIGGLLPTGFLGFVAFRFIEYNLQVYLGQALAVEVEGVRNQIDRELMRAYIDLRRLVREPDLQSEPRKIIRSFLRTTASGQIGREKFPCVALVTHRAVELSVGDCLHLPERLRSFDRIFPEGNTISTPYMLRAASPALDFWLPRGDRSGRGLLATFNLGYLSDLLTQADIKGGVYHDIFVYAADGTMLARRIPGLGLLSNTLVGFPVLEVAAGNPDGIGVGQLYDGDQAVAAVVRLVGLLPELEPIRGWRVAMVQPLSDRSEGTIVVIERLRAALKVAVVVTVAASLLFALILLRGIVGPVRQLIQATLRVRTGDLTTPIAVRGPSELHELGRFFDEMRSQLKRLLDQLTQLATTDELTGLPNRRTLDARLHEEVRRARRYGQSLCFAVMDVDHFKRINDCFGHAFGDLVLQRLADTCRRLCRDTDMMARYGGEEFAFLLPLTSKANAFLIMDRIRQAVESLEVVDEVAHYRTRLTVSVGVANLPDDAQDENSLFARADEALFAAKSAGRNQVRSASAA